MSKNYFLVIILCFLVASCSSVTRQLQRVVGTSNADYLAARSSNPELEKPLLVRLDRYKSVHTRHNQVKDLAIALAASGGGYRAANFTLGVLLGLEKLRAQNSNLLQQVDYYSSVSGGGFGVGYYLTQFHNYLIKNKNPDLFSLNNSVNAMLKHDSNLLAQDLTPYLFFGKNRGLGLEQQLNNTLLATPEGGLMLRDIFVPVDSPNSVRLPYWVPNSTIFQNAAGFPFTPDVLKGYRVTYFFHKTIPYRLGGSFSDPDYAYTVPVSVGVTASATVPFALPPVTLRSDGCVDSSSCYLQLYDGGLTDNLGVYTALSLLLQDRNKIKVLIIVDASRASSEPYSQSLAPPSNVALLWRLASVGTDSNRERIKPNINFVARDLLCDNGARNVIVVYLDLSRYPAARRIGTQLTIDPDSQKFLIHIGQEIVMKNPVIQKLVTELQAKKISLGQCPRN